MATTPRQAEADLALSYARAARRAGLAALFALDARLGDVVRSTREPLVGQMRLAWWREALVALDGGPSPAEPVLAALAREALPLGVRGAELAVMTGGWEQLLVEPLDRDAMTAFASGRGRTLFDLAALVLDGDREVREAGEGWALADLATRLRDPARAEEARSLAKERLAGVSARRWSRPLRPLGALALLARSDLAGGEAGSPGRVARLLAHRLTGL